jgi:hypothetical protein
MMKATDTRPSDWLRLKAEESESMLAIVKRDLKEKSKTLRILEKKVNTSRCKYEAILAVAERYLDNWAESAGQAEELKVLCQYFEGESFALRKQRRTAKDLMMEERAKEARASVVQDTLLHGAAAVVGRSPRPWHMQPR